jgi:hypothetical protein
MTGQHEAGLSGIRECDCGSGEIDDVLPNRISGRPVSGHDPLAGRERLQAGEPLLVLRVEDLPGPTSGPSGVAAEALDIDPS